jgi:hypothetical protein
MSGTNSKVGRYALISFTHSLSIQGRALRSSKSVGSLSALVKNLRMENSRYRAMMLEARSQVPLPNSIIVMRSLEANMERELAANKAAALADTEHPVTTGGKCASCLALWISLKHYKKEAETMGLKVQQTQAEYKEHTKANDAQTKAKTREAAQELELAKMQHESVNSTLRRRVYVRFSILLLPVLSRAQRSSSKPSSPRTGN